MVLVRFVEVPIALVIEQIAPGLAAHFGMPEEAIRQLAETIPFPDALHVKLEEPA